MRVCCVSAVRELCVHSCVCDVYIVCSFARAFVRVMCVHMRGICSYVVHVRCAHCMRHCALSRHRVCISCACIVRAVRMRCALVVRVLPVICACTMSALFVGCAFFVCAFVRRLFIDCSCRCVCVVCVVHVMYVIRAVVSHLLCV